MVKYFKYFVALVFTSTSIFGFSQSNILIDNIPKEELKTTVNTNLLIVGETLYFKTFSFLQDSQKLSHISKLAYIKLINNNKKVVSELKIKLTNGLGHGDLFIPSNLSTGNYKLITYSNWSLNNKVNPYSETDIFLINPYSKSENQLGSSSLEISLDSLFSINQKKELKSYKTRSKIQLNIKDLLDGSSIDGNYVLSVRKPDPVRFIFDDTEKNYTPTQIKSFYIPEIRGEVIQGKVVHTETQEPAPNIIVGLSITENNFLYKNAKTNEMGEYFFVLDDNYSSGILVTQIIDKNRADFSIITDQKKFPYLNNLKFKKVVLNSNLKKWILEKSIANQIENSFYSLKKDKIIEYKPSKIFFNRSKEEYILDDYNRFPTIKETFIEIIKNASVKRKKGNYYFNIYNTQQHLLSKLPGIEPLVLLDGFPIQNHEVVINMSSYNIEKIGLINEVYFYGPSIYKGILSFTTKNGNYVPKGSNNYSRKNVVHAPQKEKVYYKIDYKDSIDYKRIPDYRTQLYWEPRLESNTNTIEFYTSDINGIFEVTIEGYDYLGNYIKKKDYFSVE